MSTKPWLLQIRFVIAYDHNAALLHHCINDDTHSCGKGQNLTLNKIKTPEWTEIKFRAVDYVHKIFFA